MQTAIDPFGEPGIPLIVLSLHGKAIQPKQEPVTSSRSVCE